jgi:hypothetical protein
METIYITLPLLQFLISFAGRKNTPGYDESRKYKIAECNRDFVWSSEFQEGLIKSVLTRAPIPTIAICDNQIVDGGNRSTTLHQFVNNQFKVKLGDVEYDYDGVRANAELNNKWLSCQVNLMVVTTGGTDVEKEDQFADLYENLNKGIKLTHGQMMMNRTHYPLVLMALAMIGRTREVVFPLTALLSRVWKDTFKTTKTRSEVTLAFQILAASLFGPGHYPAKFQNHIKLFRETSQAQIDEKMGNLSRILTIIDNADPGNTILRKTKAEVFKRFNGPIIYDFHNMGSVDFQTKWNQFLRDAYTVLSSKQMKQLVDVGTKRAVSSSKNQAVSVNVREYLAGDFEFHDDASATVGSDVDDHSEE